MITSLLHVEAPSGEPPFALTQAQTILRQMVLDSVQSIHSKRNYAKALDDLFVFSASRPLSRALLMEFRTTIDHLSPSTINVRLSAIRKLVGEARRNGMIGFEEAANLSDIPNVRQKGTRLGNWLTREQAKELLAVPDRSTLKGQTRLCNPCPPGRLRSAPARTCLLEHRSYSAQGGQVGHHRSPRQGRPYPYGRGPDLGGS